MIDPRTPILVGGGQLNRREDPLEPVDMIVEAVRLAAADAGSPGIAAAADSVRIVGMLSWKYRDPGRLVSQRLGALAPHTMYTGAGGSHPQALVTGAARDIAAGLCDVVIVGGAEAWRTRMALKAEGRRPDWTVQDDDLTPSAYRDDVPMWHPTEMAAGLDRPAHVYPLFEQAIRARAGRSVDEQRWIAAHLWARFSEVAASNPHAWSSRQVGSAEIFEPTVSNRVISWPYTKFMNSNNSVEQAAAVIVCSVEAAEHWGVPWERWVFLRGAAEASDTAAIGERRHLDGSPGIRHAASTALDLAGVAVDDLGPVDLYSCFPSAVQVAATEIGLPLDDPERPLTVTGGLTFAGGPWNNYSTHAIATMIGAVRESGRPGLVTANSGYLTKHAIGVYATEPGHGFQAQDVQAAVDAEPKTPLLPGYEGEAELEAWTIRHDRDGQPDLAMASLRTVDGARALAKSDVPEVIKALMAELAEGETVNVAADASFVLR